MTRGHRVLTIGLAAVLIGVPLVTSAQALAPGVPGISPPPPVGSSTSPARGLSPVMPGTARTPRGTDTSEGGLASPRTPVIEADCTKGRWQQYGFPDQAACVKALPADTR